MYTKWGFMNKPYFGYDLVSLASRSVETSGAHPPPLLQEGTFMNETNHNYRLVVINGHDAEPSMLADYQRVYDHWYAVWSATFQEVEKDKKFFADNFTRQDEMVALFDGDRCIALMCHRAMDMRMQPFQKDSYFEPWQAEHYQELGAFGQKVIIANQFSVDPEYRRTSSGLKTSEMIAYLSFSHLSRLKVSGITGTTRDARSANAVFEKYPHKKLAVVNFHGEATSLYAFYPHLMTFEKISPEVREISDHLWETAKVSDCVPAVFQADPYLQSGNRRNVLPFSA